MTTSFNCYTSYCHIQHGCDKETITFEQQNQLTVRQHIAAFSVSVTRTLYVTFEWHHHLLTVMQTFAAYSTTNYWDLNVWLIQYFPSMWKSSKAGTYCVLYDVSHCGTVCVCGCVLCHSLPFSYLLVLYGYQCYVQANHSVTSGSVARVIVYAFMWLCLVL